MWDKNSFDAGEHLTAKEPIDANVVMQLHPDTGARAHRPERLYAQLVPLDLAAVCFVHYAA